MGGEILKLPMLAIEKQSSELVFTISREVKGVIRRGRSYLHRSASLCSQGLGYKLMSKIKLNVIMLA